MSPTETSTPTETSSTTTATIGRAVEVLPRAMTLELPGLDHGSVQDYALPDGVATILELFCRTLRPDSMALAELTV